MARRDLYVSEAATRSAVEAGLRWFAQHGAEFSGSPVWLVTGIKAHLDGIVGQAIGQNCAKHLGKGDSVPLAGRPLVYYSERNLPNFARGAVILACFPTKSLLDKLDRLTDASALIVVPYLLDEIQPWLAARGATDILGRSDVKRSTVSNTVVLNALKSIYNRINATAALAHSNDRNSVIEAFQILSKAGESIDSDEVRAYFLQKGLDPRDANAIAEIAKNPGAHRRSSTEKRWAADILDQWRSDATTDSDEEPED